MTNLKNIFSFTLLLSSAAQAQEYDVTDVLQLDPPLEINVPCAEDHMAYYLGPNSTLTSQVGFIGAASPDSSASLNIIGERPESDIGYIDRIEIGQIITNTELKSAFSEKPNDSDILTETTLGYTAAGLKALLQSCPAAYAVVPQV